MQIVVQRLLDVQVLLVYDNKVFRFNFQKKVSLKILHGMAENTPGKF